MSFTTGAWVSISTVLAPGTSRSGCTEFISAKKVTRVGRKVDACPRLRRIRLMTLISVNGPSNSDSQAPVTDTHGSKPVYIQIQPVKGQLRGAISNHGRLVHFRATTRAPAGTTIPWTLVTKGEFVPSLQKLPVFACKPFTLAPERLYLGTMNNF